MTTIAWDGKCMAADRMVTFGTTPMAMKKLFRIKFDGKDAIVGMSGTADEWQPVIEWLQDRRSRPCDRSAGGGEFQQGLVIHVSSPQPLTLRQCGLLVRQIRTSSQEHQP